MSQQSLASKTITKRNVAQSSIIFSVIVSLVTLGFIGGAAFLDISKENAIAHKERDDLLKEFAQDNDLESISRQEQLIQRANHLVKAIDDKAMEIKILEKQVNEADKKVDQLAKRQQEIQILNDKKLLEYLSHVENLDTNKKYPLNSKTDWNYWISLNEYYRHQINANADVEFNVAWVFKSRSKMNPAYVTETRFLGLQKSDVLMKQL